MTGPTSLKRVQSVYVLVTYLLAMAECPIKAIHRRRGLSWLTIQVIQSIEVGQEEEQEVAGPMVSLWWFE